ncbi:hypothetical protein [Halpernia frigidisoli]|uniref:Uncharacterized protein n=1 Tax=Halpernia frigidisoli TaxID=1125876 RepID=A0A1I3FE49_9FLAO|nr:hypothetical protein [Halpernia frigidisoli]SFI09499.1 hypothetical protein SAMN05443292_1322 [Halpernia frigidisoli]
MKKIFDILLYMILHPFRVMKIVKLYFKLKGKYRFTIILAHIYKEVYYRKKNKEKKTFNITSDIDTGKQVIINVQEGLFHTGGISDRLKGICTLYMYSKKYHYIFKVHFIFPFKLEKYLLPNHYDWCIDEKNISYDLNSTAVYTWENELFVEDFFQSNRYKKQLHVSCNSWECLPKYSELFNELFKPSPYLKEEIEFHTKNLGGSGNYISISFRFQNLLGEFKEGESMSLNTENRKILINKCLLAINDLKQQYDNIDKILITSDSNVFRDIAEKKYSFVYTFTIAEETGHIDFAGVGKGKEMTAFLDMFLISGAKKAYQIRSAEMYDSDFPNVSARIKKVPYEMILID